MLRSRFQERDKEGERQWRDKESENKDKWHSHLKESKGESKGESKRNKRAVAKKKEKEEK